MKQSKWNKILVPSVLAIWVGVLLRFGGSCSSQEVSTPQAQQLVQLNVGNSSQAQFELLLDYSDPFLNRPARKAKSSPPRTSGSKGKLIPIPPPKPSLKLPVFAYQGGVQSPSGGFTGLLMADGKIMNIQQGDTIFGMEVSRLTLHSVYLSHPDSSLVLNKN
ncbi:MAG: hypothetical protein AAF587_31770 [Bacteroidota bacterium]